MVDRSPNRVDPTLRVSDASERTQAVVAFLRDQAEREETALRSELRRQRVHHARRWVMVPIWLGVVYAWTATPDWLTVDPVPVQTVVEDSESLRVNMWLQSQRIEAYRATRGRLPFVLDEAGPRFRGMEYRRKDNRYYELTARSERVALRYESRQSADDFVGDAVNLLRTSEGASQ